MRLKSISLIIIMGGIFFSLYLLGQVADGVYFSGDGGLKALLAKQLASGELRFDLAIPQEAWIRELWKSGLYPYEPPYVYQVTDKYYITFPYTFPLVTAPFYALFGERGLYAIPLVSCWIIWFIFYLDCEKLKLNSFITNLALINLIFGSYLTVYSAMYWEHTLAIAANFTGLSFWYLLCRKKQLNKTSNQQQVSYQKASVIQAIMSGFLIGLAVWFRPEFICVVIIVIGLAILSISYSKWHKTLFLDGSQLQPILFPAKQQIIFVISLILTVGGFFFSNQIIYGYAVGIHGIQVVESIALSDRLLGAWHNFTGMSLKLLEYLPIIYIPILYLIAYVLQQLLFKQIKLIKLNILSLITYLSIITFIIGVSLLVPVGTAGLISGGKQWGVRFLLILVPIITLLAALQIQQVFTNKIIKYFSIIILVILAIIGVNKNTFQASKILIQNNQVTAAAVEFLQTDSNKYILISHEFVGQALEAATVDHEIFFTVDTIEELHKFSRTLIQQKQERFTYICYPHRACTLPKTQAQDLQFQQSDRKYQIQFNLLDKFGKYPIYQGEIKLISHPSNVN